MNPFAGSLKCPSDIIPSPFLARQEVSGIVERVFSTLLDPSELRTPLLLEGPTPLVVVLTIEVEEGERLLLR